MGSCCLPFDRVKLTLNTKKEINSKVKIAQEAKWAKNQDELISFIPKRVKLTVNSKKEMNSRVKLAKGQDGHLLFTP